MAFRAAVLNIIIASPSDLADERKSARQAIHEWNDLHAEAEGIVLLPMGWESHATPQTGARAQAIINKQMVTKADILIGVFWTKFGTHTGAAESGTVEEIDQIVTAGKRAMLYFSTRPVDPDKIDLKQMKKLKAFKSQTYQKALTGTFTSPDDFRQILMRDITRLVRELKAEWSTETASEEGTEEAEAIPDVDRASILSQMFYARFSRGNFHDIYQPVTAEVVSLDEPTRSKPRDAYLLLSVIPLKPLTQPLDIAAIERLRPVELRPIGDDNYSLEGYGRSLVVHDGDERQKTAATTVMELNDDGCIYAALRLLVWPKRVEGLDAVNLEMQERMVLKSLRQYVKLLRDLSVVEPLDVRVILHGLNDVYIAPVDPADPSQWDHRRFRPLVDGTVFSTPVTFDADIDGRSLEPIAAAMRQAFQVIWRDAGYQHDPCYDKFGRLLPE